MTEAEAIASIANEIADGDFPILLAEEIARNAFAALHPYLDAQFAAGAAAMREASFQAAVEEIKQDFGEDEDDTYNAAIWCVMDAIRALPIPARGDGGKV